MPDNNKRILTPMWMVDDKLYPYKAYVKTKYQLSRDVTNMRRVWVGWQKEALATEEAVQVDATSKWIFEDHELVKGYEEVKRHNKFDA